MPLATSVPLTITPGAFEASVAGVRDMLYRSPIPTRAADAPGGFAGGLVHSGPPVAPPEASLDLPPVGHVELPHIEPRSLAPAVATAPVTRLTSSDHPTLTFAAPEPDRPPATAIPDISGPLEWSPERGFFNPNDPPPVAPTPEIDLSPKTLRMLRPRGTRRLGLGDPITDDDYVEVEIPVAPPPSPPPDEPPMLAELPEPEPVGPPKVRYIPVPGGRERVPDDLRSSMLHRFGADVGSRPVIRDVGATEQARMLHARAFVRGGDVYIPAEAGDLDEAANRQLLAHELTHVAQQQALGGRLPAESSLEGRALEAAAQQVGAYMAGVPGADLPPVELVVPRSVPAVRRTVEDILTSLATDEDLVAKGYASRAGDGALVFGPPSWVAAAGPVQRADVDYSWQHPVETASWRTRMRDNFDVGGGVSGSAFGQMLQRTTPEPTEAQLRQRQIDFETTHASELHRLRGEHEDELLQQRTTQAHEQYLEQRRRAIQRDETVRPEGALPPLTREDAIHVREQLDQDRPLAHLQGQYKNRLPDPTPTPTPETTEGGEQQATTGTPPGTGATTPTPGHHPAGGNPPSNAPTPPGGTPPRTAPPVSGNRTTTGPGATAGLAHTRPGGARPGASSSEPNYGWEDESRSTGQAYGDFLAGSLMGGILGGSRMQSWLGGDEDDRRESRESDPEFRGRLIQRRKARETELRQEQLEDARREARARYFREGGTGDFDESTVQLNRDQMIAIRQTVDSEMPLHTINEGDYEPIPPGTPAATTQATTPPGGAGAGAGVATTPAATPATTPAGTPATTPPAAATPGAATPAAGTAAGGEPAPERPSHTNQHGEDRDDPIFDRFAHHDLDRLARLLYERVRRQLRTELLVDRERTGTLSDHR